MVEINPALMGYLQARLERANLLARPDVDVRLICADLLAFPLAADYDIVICSLPFSNFPVDLVDGLLAQIIGHLKPGGVFSYVKYAGLGALKRWASSAAGREKIDRKQALFDAYAKTHLLERRLVVRNVPPSWVYYWRKPIPPATVHATATPSTTTQKDSHVIHA
ncbi:MAG: class I SAM-dependent methyltransferase [Caldilineaceae bacterium]|nr:class I SAM-dependent methyltransferase [Caldilineaceae bacterium]